MWKTTVFINSHNKDAYFNFLLFSGKKCNLVTLFLYVHTSFCTVHFSIIIFFVVFYSGFPYEKKITAIKKCLI